MLESKKANIINYIENLVPIYYLYSQNFDLLLLLIEKLNKS